MESISLFLTLTTFFIGLTGVIKATIESERKKEIELLKAQLKATNKTLDEEEIEAIKQTLSEYQELIEMLVSSRYNTVGNKRSLNR